MYLSTVDALSRAVFRLTPSMTRSLGGVMPARSSSVEKTSMREPSWCDTYKSMGWVSAGERHQT